MPQFADLMMGFTNFPAKPNNTKVLNMTDYIGLPTKEVIATDIR